MSHVLRTEGVLRSPNADLISKRILHNRHQLYLDTKAAMANDFVFIVERQQGGYSGATISSINSQVAKYVHQRRRMITKSNSEPPFTPVLSNHPKCNIQNDRKGQPQDLQVIRGSRRRSAPAVNRCGSRQKQEDCGDLNWHDGKGENLGKSSPRQNPVDAVSKNDLEEQGKENQPDSQDISELFRQLCSVTKSPDYQPFPLNLDSEERRLMHFCKYLASVCA